MRAFRLDIDDQAIEKFVVADAVESVAKHGRTSVTEDDSVKRGGKVGGVTVGEIFQHVLFKNIENWTQGDARAVGICIKQLGWERYQAGAGSDREWRYRQRQRPRS